jgi:type I restriction enzyme, S subunit
MIADLTPYPGMRDSGVVWLGEVPNGWGILRGRQLFEIKKRIAGERGRPVISVTQEGLRVKDVASGEGQLSQDYSKYQTVEVGEFAMNSMDLVTGGVGIATSPGVTSPDYRVFSIRERGTCCDRYMLYVLRMLYRNRGFYAWGQGSAQLGRWRLPRRRFNDFPFPVPSFIEQAAIARFLDWANGRLKRAMRAKRKVIALLNEQTRAIIHRAVTRGLDPSVPLKSSGVPWLGDIPRHWEVRRLRHLIIGRLNYGANAAAEFTNPDWPRYIRITDFRTDGSLKADTFRSLPPAIASGYIVSPGDILFARSGATVGKAFLVQGLAGSACHAGYLIRARPDQHLVRPEYLFAFTQSNAFGAWKDSTFNTATIQNIAADKYANLRVPLPTLPEQGLILESVTIQQRPLLATISRLGREIELLREYGARLVADVVTGKLDVREAAARLPDEASSDTTEDDADVGAEGEPADAESIA